MPPCRVLVRNMVAYHRKCDNNILHVLVFDTDAVAIRPVSLVLVDVGNSSAAYLNDIVNTHQVAYDTQLCAVYHSADFGVHDAESLFQFANRLFVPYKYIFIQYLRYFPFQLQYLSAVLLNGKAVACNIRPPHGTPHSYPYRTRQILV